MVKFVTIFISILFLHATHSFGQLRSASDLLGIWSGNQLRVEFIDNSRVSVVFPGGKKQAGSYTADFFHSPVLLEMAFTEGGGKVEFKCLVQLTKSNALRWQLFSKTDYPKNFSGSSYVLNKVKN